MLDTPNSIRHRKSGNSPTSSSRPDFRRPEGGGRSRQAHLFLCTFLGFMIGLLVRLESQPTLGQSTQKSFLGVRLIEEDCPTFAGNSTPAEVVETKCHCPRNATTNEQSKPHSPKPEPVECNGSPQTSAADAPMPLFAGGALKLGVDDFSKIFDAGIPQMDHRFEHRAIIFYPNTKTRPANMSTTSPVEATENCKAVKVIYHNGYDQNTCFAISHSWDSYIVHNFRRYPNSTDASFEDLSKPLRYVSRSHVDYRGDPPMENYLDYYPLLASYLSTYSDALERLRPVAAEAAGGNSDLVVMFSNYGQSTILLNFVCFARSRGIDLSRLLVFCTDNKVYQLVKSLGLVGFDVQNAFGDMPKEGAGAHLDKAFGAMMMAKTYAIQMSLDLGYNVLYQDADIVWYEDPLPFFAKLADETSMDVLFMDDGAPALVFMPYRANAGCFYARNSKLTRDVWSQLALLGNFVLETANDQSMLNLKLSDFASRLGLRIKTISMHSDDGRRLPSGVFFHWHHDYMRKLMKNETFPVLYHCHWTANSREKKEFYEQMAMWYVKDACANSTSVDRMNECCSNVAITRCHYVDMPNVFPGGCNHTNKLDPKKSSFWE